ncbi:MAG: tetratricopeptide repeat protein [Erythrobacter sp.]
MRSILLALALVFSTANTAPSVQTLVDEEKYAEAFKQAKTDAAKGDGEAHNWLGLFYENGVGVEADVKKAEQHYRAAAELGEAHAKWRLGVLIDTGAIEGELTEAVALFQAAADDGYIDGCQPCRHASHRPRNPGKFRKRANELYGRSAIGQRAWRTRCGRLANAGTRG